MTTRQRITGIAPISQYDSIEVQFEGAERGQVEIAIVYSDDAGKYFHVDYFQRFLEGGAQTITIPTRDLKYERPLEMADPTPYATINVNTVPRTVSDPRSVVFPVKNVTLVAKSRSAAPDPSLHASIAARTSQISGARRFREPTKTPAGKPPIAGILLTEVSLTLPIFAGILMVAINPLVSDSTLLWGGFISFSALLTALYVTAFVQFYRAGDLRKKGMAGFFAALGIAGLMAIYYLFQIASFAQVAPDFTPVASRIFAGMGFVLPPIVGLAYWLLMWFSRRFSLNKVYEHQHNDQSEKLNNSHQQFIEARVGVTSDARIAWIRQAIEQHNGRAVDFIRYVLGHDAEADVRREAALALGAMGRREALSQLEKVKEFDPHGLVRAAASEAIAQLRAQTPSKPPTGSAGDVSLPLGTVPFRCCYSCAVEPLERSGKAAAAACESCGQRAALSKRLWGLWETPKGFSIRIHSRGTIHKPHQGFLLSLPLAF
jgi:hypothetical protein